eukprot:GHRR01005378.1.p1 GENE.GHRR01005378.1~~GHRR01005378.1.p1  ORF type:complete len:390 (+),score=179.45 GHRR01005378.1:231-1400(+)
MQDLHARFEPLLIFTIDGANFIDADDAKWEVLVAVRETNGQQQLVGLLLQYNFYAWPLNQRPRVAQVLVVPPLQGSGIGKALIATAYDLAHKRDAVDLTFEDPVLGLQRVREKLELEQMLACPWLVEAADAALKTAEGHEVQQQAAARQLWKTAGCNGQQQAGQQRQPQQQSGSSNGTVAADTGQQPQGRGQGQQASGAGVRAQAHAAGASAQESPPASSASLLTLPEKLQQRVIKELKIHKRQVPAVWEALLVLISPLGSHGMAAADHALHEPLTELIMGRLEAAHAAMADRYAANKRIVVVEGSKEDWFVYKVVPRKQWQSKAAPGTLPEPLTDTVNVGRHTVRQVSADDWSERLQQLTAERLEQLMHLKQKIPAAVNTQATGSSWI